MRNSLNRLALAFVAACLTGCQQEEPPKKQDATPTTQPSAADLRIEAVTEKYRDIRAKLRQHPVRDDWSDLQRDREILEQELARIDPFRGLTLEYEDKLDQKAEAARNISAANRILSEGKRP